MLCVSNEFIYPGEFQQDTINILKYLKDGVKIYLAMICMIPEMRIKLNN